jgi:dehydrogenase/reductase SDR family protein 12
MGTDTGVTHLSPVAAAADVILDKLVVPGYSAVGPFFRRHWWPADPKRFVRQVDVLVTGGSSGLGAAAAAGLTALGARVHLVGRKADTLQTSASKIRVRQPGAELTIHESDVSDLDAVRKLAADLARELGSLHAVVHCAGVLPAKRSESRQGHEMAFATHVLGPFLLTDALRPLLQADRDGRVVFVSSGGMYTADLESDFEYTKGEFKGVRAYARTKRMQVVLAEQLAAAFTADSDPVVHSMHPGWAATPGITDSLPGFNKIVKPILRSPESGADTIVWLAGSAEAGSSTGKFWQDRRVRSTHYLPWQHDDPAIRRQLWDTCVRDTGALIG